MVIIFPVRGVRSSSMVGRPGNKKILITYGRNYKSRLIFILMPKWSLYFRPEWYVLLFQGAIVNRTYGTHKNLYISQFLLKIFGPIYYGPP